MGIIFKAPAVLIWIVCGIWGFLICFGIVQSAIGTVLAFISMMFAPFVLALAPWYSGLVWGEWFPLLLTYGGTIGGGLLFGLGSAIDGD